MKTRPELEPSRAGPRRRPMAANRRAGSKSSAASLAFRRILVPVDFSAGSETALRHAATLARLHGAHVLPIHVTPPICFTVDCGYGPVNRKVPDENSLRLTRARLQKLVHRIVGAELAEEVTVCSGETIEQIVKAAAERNADLIVVLAHDALGGKPMPLTHTVDRLVRETRCPVLAVHGCEPSRIHPSSKRERTR